MSTTDTRAAFEAWAKDEGLIQESHGILSISSMCDVARKAFDAGIAHAEAAKAAGTAGELPPLKSINDDPGFWQKVSNWARVGESSAMEIRAKQMTDYVDQRMREYGQACAEAARIRNPKFSAEDIEAMIQGRAAEIAAARQPAPVLAVKTWQERMDEDPALLELGALHQENADLRAALATATGSIADRAGRIG